MERASAPSPGFSGRLSAGCEICSSARPKGTARRGRLVDESGVELEDASETTAATAEMPDGASLARVEGPAIGCDASPTKRSSGRDGPCRLGSDAVDGVTARPPSPPLLAC